MMILSNDREHYYDYNAVTPGPKCINWEEVMDKILKNFSTKRKGNKEQLYV